MNPNAGIDLVSGVTAQVLAFGRDPLSILWGHNKEDIGPPNINIHNGTPKPAGWGNLGGGLEWSSFHVPHLDRWFEGELDYLNFHSPGHPILTDSTLSNYTKNILACGLREFIHETGYCDIAIRTDFRNEYGEPFLFDYLYKPDRNGKRHRVVTLWGEVKSFRRQEAVEKQEVDRTGWMDLSSSLIRPFFNRRDYPGRPYYSHVLRVLKSLNVVDRHNHQIDEYAVNIRRNIHPSWRMVFRVGEGDSRFPEGGYWIPPPDWYTLFERMVRDRKEMADNSYVYDLFRDKIDNKRKLQNEELEAKIAQEISPAPAEAVLQDSEDCDGLLKLAEIVEKEDREYALWYERELSLPAYKRVS